MQRAPGTGQSKKARARRNRKTTTITTTTTRQRPQPQQVVKVVQQPRRNQNGRKRTSRPISLYMRSLIDPEFTIGAKCPGPTGVPTGTYQLTSDFTASTDASGYYGLAVNPMVFYSSATAPGAYVPSTSTAGVATWAGNIYLGNATTAYNLYDSFRVVSGCLKVEYIGNTSVDSGLCVGFWDSPTIGANTASALQTYMNTNYASTSTALSLAYNESYPLRHGQCITWRPLDYSDWDFVDNGSAHVNCPLIGFQIIGAPVSTACLKVRIIFNYEAVGRNDTLNLINMSTNPGESSDTIRQAATWGSSQSDKVRPLTGIWDDAKAKMGSLLQKGADNLASSKYVRDYAVNAAAMGIAGLTRRFNRQLALEYI